MKIHCKYDELVKIENLNLNPKNPNRHSKGQIKRLAEILAFQGWRAPVRVSKTTSLVTVGHGRIMAAQLNKWDSVPVVYQEYTNQEEEYADLVGDNAIARWAELDLSAVHLELPNLDGGTFDLDILGIESFRLDLPENFSREEGLDREELEVLVKIGLEYKDELIGMLESANFPFKFELQHVRVKT